MRQQTKKWVKDGDLFLIRYYPRQRSVTTQLITGDETTFDLSDMERKERWQYYASSYVRVEYTEGVPRQRIRRTVLPRNIPYADTASDDDVKRQPVQYDEQLILLICVNSYKIMFKQNTSEWFIYSGDATKTPAELERVKGNRNQRFREKFIMNSPWMKNMSQGQVQQANEDFDKWTKGTTADGSATVAPIVEAAAADADAVMN